jgi:hypothetical protein
MNSPLRLSVSALVLAGLLAAPSLARAAEHSLGAPAGSQEPDPGQLTLEIKDPVRPEVPLVFAQDAGETAPTITFDERQRRALLYSAGANVVNLVALETLMAEETARRSSAGLWVGREVTEQMVDDKLQEQVDLFLAAAPNGDFWRQKLIEGYTEDGYRRTIALVLRVSEMFFPPDPEQWPVALLEEIFGAGKEGSHWDPVKQELDGRLEMKAKGQVIPPMPSDFVFSYIMLPGVFAWMRGNAEILGPSAGLPEGVALRVNGREFATADLLAQCESLISPVLEEQAERFVESMQLAEDALRKQGKWLSRATLDALWEAERAEYEGTIFTHEQTVLEFLGFPSIEHYRQFFDARRSFRTTMPDPFPEEWIQAEIAERGAFLGLGKIKADVILIAAVDPAALESAMAPKVFRPGADPFGQYEGTAQEVAQMLKDGDDFSQLLLEYSNYPPKAPGNNFLQRDRGRFDALSRADLRVLLGESDYTDFLQGYSIGDDAFFRGEVGAVYGPVRGPLGWYFYRVNRRDPPSVALDPANNARQAYQLGDDLLSQRFLAFVHGLRE